MRSFQFGTVNGNSFGVVDEVTDVDTDTVIVKGVIGNGLDPSVTKVEGGNDGQRGGELQRSEIVGTLFHLEVVCGIITVGYTTFI